MCPLPCFFDRHFPFKHLILIRQLTVFSNLLLHQISCLLTDFGLPFPSLWCFSCAPWHITKASAEAGSAEYVSTGSEAAVWWSRTSVSMSSQGWRQLCCRTLEPSLPCLQRTPQGLCGAWDCRAWGGTLFFLLHPKSSSSRAPVAACLAETRAYQAEPFFGTVPLGNELSWALETSCADCPDPNNNNSTAPAAKCDS